MILCDLPYVQNVLEIDRLTRENAKLRDQLQSLLDAVTYPFSDEPECNVTFHRNLDNAVEASHALLESIK